MLQDKISQELKELEERLKLLEKKVNLYRYDNLICAVLSKCKIDEISLDTFELNNHDIYIYMKVTKMD